MATDQQQLQVFRKWVMALFRSAPGEDSSSARRWATWPVLTALFLLLLIGIGGFLQFKLQLAASRQTAQSQLSTIADLKVTQITTWYQEQQTDAQLIFHTPMI